MAITHRWRAHIEAWQSSGLSQAGYCRQHQLNVRTFTARLSEYRKGKPVLIPVTVIEEPEGFNTEPKKVVVYCPSRTSGWPSPV